MICQFCETDHPPGVKDCGKCGCELVECLAAEEEELTFDPLPIVDDREVFAAVVARLEAERIPYTAQSGTGLVMFETQSLGEVAQPETWEARVMVISSRYAEAEEALRAATPSTSMRGARQRQE